MPTPTSPEELPDLAAGSPFITPGGGLGQPVRRRRAPAGSRARPWTWRTCRVPPRRLAYWPGPRPPRPRHPTSPRSAAPAHPLLCPGARSPGIRPSTGPGRTQSAQQSPGPDAEVCPDTTEQRTPPLDGPPAARRGDRNRWLQPREGTGAHRPVRRHARPLDAAGPVPTYRPHAAGHPWDPVRDVSGTKDRGRPRA